MPFNTSYIDSIPNPETISSAWGTLRRGATSAITHLDGAATKWKSIDTQLRLPAEMREFYAAFEPVEQTTAELEEKVRNVGSAVDEYVETLRGLREWRTRIRGDINSYTSTYPEGADLSLGDRWDRYWARKGIQDDIHSLGVSFELAEERLERALSTNALTAPPVVPLHFPGGGDRFDRAQASALVDALVKGTSEDPIADYRKLLALLEDMSPEDIAQLARENPNMVLVVPPTGADAGRNRKWWDALSRKPGGEELQAALKEHASSLIGNMEGLTYEDRNEANQRTLEIVLQRVQEQKNGIRDWGYTSKQIQAYENLQQTLESGRARQAGSGTEIGLLAFDSIGVDGEPLAAIAIGNPDRATHQSWYIPGMGSSLERNIGGVYGDAESIWNKQQESLGAHESNSMVVWMGYDAPKMAPSTEVLRSTHAREGGVLLTDALNGMNVANTHRSGPMPYTSVTAHSYGTTTATYALANIDFRVNSAVYFGSAGLDKAAASTADGLQVLPDPRTDRPAVYAGTAMRDNVARIPTVLSSQEGWSTPRYSPTGERFGGNVFQVDGEDRGAGVSGHEARKGDRRGYLDEGTQSLDSIARLSVGRGDDIPLYDEGERDYLEYVTVTAPHATPAPPPERIDR